MSIVDKLTENDEHVNARSPIALAGEGAGRVSTRKDYTRQERIGQGPEKQELERQLGNAGGPYIRSEIRLLVSVDSFLETKPT